MHRHATARVTQDDITGLLERWSRGDRDSAERLFEAVYPELQRVANRYLARERGVGTLEATELANETFIRMAGERGRHWQSKAHFFAIFATHLRRALVDQVRHRNRAKRGGGTISIALDGLGLAVDAPAIDLLDLNRALIRLAETVPMAARVVELRFFAGLTLDQTAEALALGRSTVRRKWRFSKAWLTRALSVEE